MTGAASGGQAEHGRNPGGAFISRLPRSESSGRDPTAGRPPLVYGEIPGYEVLMGRRHGA